MARVMARNPINPSLATWHVWHGWLVGLPIAMRRASGLFMTLQPIAGVRSRWWDWCDNSRGRHITPPRNREGTNHPVPIGFAALSLTGAMIGCVLMFRRRRARPKGQLGQ